MVANKKTTVAVNTQSRVRLAGILVWGMLVAAGTGSSTVRADLITFEHELVGGAGNVKDLHIRIDGGGLTGVTVKRHNPPPPPGGSWTDVDFQSQSGPAGSEWGGGDVNGANAPIGGDGKTKIRITRQNVCDADIEIWETFDGTTAIPRDATGALLPPTKRYRSTKGRVTPYGLYNLMDLEADGITPGSGGDIDYLIHAIYTDMDGAYDGSSDDTDGDGYEDWADPGLAGGSLLAPERLTVPYGCWFSVGPGTSVPLLNGSQVVGGGSYMLVVGQIDFHDGALPVAFRYGTNSPEPGTLALLLFGGLTPVCRRLRLRRS